MILLDASGLVDLVIDGPGAARVEGLLREESVMIPTPNLAEVIDVLQRRFGLTEAELRNVLEPLLVASLKSHRPTAAEAWRAGMIRARHYSRQEGLSLADSILIGCATESDTIASGDGLLLKVATEEGVETLPLP